MVRESFAACVSRHLAAMEQCAKLLYTSQDSKERDAAYDTFLKSTVVIELEVQKRIEKSAYEAERRAGQELADVVMVVRQRRG